MEEGQKGMKIGQMRADSLERTGRVPFAVLDFISRLDLIPRATRNATEAACGDVRVGEALAL